MGKKYATNRGRRVLAFLLAAVMTFSMLGSYSLPTYAAGGENQVEISGIGEEDISTESTSNINVSENDVETESESEIETVVKTTEETETIVETTEESGAEATEENGSETETESTGEPESESETVVETIEETESESETVTEESGTEESETETVVETAEEIETETETIEETAEELLTETAEEVEETETEAEEETTEALIKAAAESEAAEEYTLGIIADTNAIKVSARIGAQAIAYELTDGGYKYTVSSNDTVTVTVTANENYKITGAVTQKDGAAEKTEKYKGTGFVYSVNMSANTETEIKTEALYQALLMQDDSVIKSVKNVYTVLPGKYSAEILYGNSKALLEEVTVENASCMRTTGSLSEDRKRAEFTIDSDDAGNAKLKYVVKTETGESISFAIKVRPAIQKVTVKGVKNGVLKQTVDTEKTYKVSVTPSNADIENLYIVTEGNIEAVLEKNQLKVKTKTAVGEKQGAVRFYRKTSEYVEGTEITGAAVQITTVEPKALNKAMPTVKLAEADDTTLTFNLGIAANVEVPVQGAQYYEIKVTPDATTAVPEEIAAACKEPEYRLREGNSQTESVSVNTIAPGNGQKWKFAVEVRLVQTAEKKAAKEVTAQDITYSSKVKKVNASTLKPAYETKLGIKKAAGSVYTGQGEVCIGTPVFSKNTSYRSLDKVLDITDGLTEEEKLQLVYKDGKIYAIAPAGSNVAISKHTIIAYATAPAGSKAATATLNVNVVRGIEDLAVTTSAKQIYKKYNKAASVAIITSYNNLVTAELPEAKAKKVVYSIVDTDGEAFSAEDPLYGMVSVKNGKATINKNYVVSSVKSDNVFCIKAVANDYKGNTVCAYSEPIEICSTTIAPGAVMLVSKEPNADNAYEIISRGNATLKIEELNRSKVVIVKKGSEQKTALATVDILDIRTFNVTTNNKAVSISEDGSIYSEQAVKNLKITAATKDGSNLKAVLEKLTITYSDTLALGVNISRATYVYTGENAQFYTIASPDSTTVTYSAGKNEIFKLDVMTQDEDGNWIAIDDNAYMNYSLSLTGGKQISKDKDTYLISATDAKTVITLTDKANNKKKTVYTLVNEALANKKLTSLKVATADTLAAGYYEGTQSITLNVTAGGDYSYYDEEEFGKYAEVRVDVADSIKNKEKYESFTKYTSDIDGYHGVYIDTEYEYDEDGEIISSTPVRTVSISFSKEAYTNILAGNYKLNVTLGTVQHGDFIPDTQTASVTVKAVENKVPKLTFKPVTAYTLYTKSTDMVELQGTLNKKNYSYSYTGIHNVIENGEVNHFLDYFDFVAADIENNVPAKLRLKQGIDLASITEFDEKAFVDYQIYDADGKVVKEESVLISVKVRDIASPYKIKLLSFVRKFDGSTMFTTGEITYGSKPVNVSHALFLSDTYTVSANGTSTLKIMTDTAPDRGSDYLDLYIIPEGSYYESKLEACKDSGDTEQYAQWMQEYGAKIKRVGLKFAGESNSKITLPTRATLNTKNFSRENKLSGEYIVPLVTSRMSQAAEIDYIKVSAEDSSFARMDVVKDVNGKANITLVVDKYNLALTNDRKIAYTVHYTNGMSSEDKTIQVSVRDWQTYEEALRMMERVGVKYSISSKWTGDQETSVENALKKAVARLGKAAKADSHAVLSVSINDTEVIAPTRTDKGAMKVYATLTNTIPELSFDNAETEKTYTLNVTFPALGAWPEDIAGELDSFLNGYHTEESQKVFNHTKAEDIAAAIKAQEFIQKYDWFRVDVSNVVRQKATELEKGSLSARVRIIDTTRRGQAYDQIWTWTLYELDTLQEAADRLTNDFSVAEVDNRITKEDTVTMIDTFLINEDIVWSWKKVVVNGKETDDYTKTLATAEQTGTVTGTIILQNPKSLIDTTQTLEVPFTIQIKKMTDPAVIYSMVNSVVGQDVLTYEMFSEKVYTDEMNEEYEWKRLSEKEMREVVLETANQVLVDADELYYVEYAKDEDEKDLFHYQPMTYKFNESVSYTLVIRNECTDEIVGEQIVVNEFILSEADGSLQTLKDWEADVEALIKNGNANGTFTNDITEDTIISLAESVRTNYSLVANLKYSYDENTDEYFTDFVLTTATMETSGSATATLYLVEEYYGDDGEYIQKGVITMNVKLLIPEIDQSIDEAALAISNTITVAQSNNVFSNKTTAADILTMVKENIKNKKFSVAWSQPFALTEATKEAAGSITGEIKITNNNPASGEALEKTVAVSIVLAKLKTADEAQEAVRNVVTGDALYEIIATGKTASSVKTLLLSRANQVVQHDGFTVSVKQEDGVDVFGYCKNTYKEDGYIYFTLLLTADDGNADETREIEQANVTLPVDVTLQTRSLAVTDIKNLIKEMAANGEITNDTTLEQLIEAAESVIVNPSLQILEESCSMKLGLAATESRTGKLSFTFVVCDEDGRTSKSSVTVVIPRLTTS